MSGCRLGDINRKKAVSTVIKQADLFTFSKEVNLSAWFFDQDHKNP